MNKQLSKYCALILFLNFLFFSALPAQFDQSNNKYKSKFSFDIGTNEKIIRTWYHYVVSEYHKGYRVRIFHPDKKSCTQIIDYEDKKCTIKNGAFQSFYDNGSVFQSGHYQSNLKVGKWTESNFSKTTWVGNYSLGLRSGQWKLFDTDSLLTERTTYVDGKKSGLSEVYDSLGIVTVTRVYEQDSLIEHEEFSHNIIQEVMPSLKHCQNNDLEIQNACTEKMLLMHIYSNLRYPAIAREYGIEGTAYVQYVVEKDGKIADIELLSGLSNEIERVIMKTIDNMPEWIPGYKNEEAVKVLYTLPVRFRLE